MRSRQISHWCLKSNKTRINEFDARVAISASSSAAAGEWPASTRRLQIAWWTVDPRPRPVPVTSRAASDTLTGLHSLLDIHHIQVNVFTSYVLVTTNLVYSISYCGFGNRYAFDPNPNISSEKLIVDYLIAQIYKLDLVYTPPPPPKSTPMRFRGS